jgi:hypothetical protein
MRTENTDGKVRCSLRHGVYWTPQLDLENNRVNMSNSDFHEKLHAVLAANPFIGISHSIVPTIRRLQFWAPSIRSLVDIYYVLAAKRPGMKLKFAPYIFLIERLGQTDFSCTDNWFVENLFDRVEEVQNLVFFNFARP